MLKKGVMSLSFKYGEPVVEIPKPRANSKIYDECLYEFLSSGYNYWKVDLSKMPNSNPKAVLCSLKWRIRNKPEFKSIRVIMRKGQIYLERVS